jgi:16S rRNA (guanine966-N2)-methyltransferase
VARQHKQTNQGQCRIIAGQWRGRKLVFPEVNGLRPTGDRIRETLFNWLQPFLPGNRCLDCFAGSGALGFEAASRGAEHVVMIEADAQAYQSLLTSKTTLKAQQCEILQGRVEALLAGITQPFDVVFMDPPFALDLWSSLAERLTRHQLLADGARIYVEYPKKLPTPQWPESWNCLKEKQAGEVKYALYEFQAGASE